MPEKELGILFGLLAGTLALYIYHRSDLSPQDVMTDLTKACECEVTEDTSSLAVRPVINFLRGSGHCCCWCWGWLGKWSIL